MGADLRIIDGEGHGDAPVTRRPRGKFCQHHRFELDTGARRVYCGECEQEMDAFDALLTLATMFERVNGRYKTAKAEAKRIEQSLSELKRQERNAKARLKRVVPRHTA